MTTLLNTSILTSYGTYNYVSIELDKVKKIVKRGGVISAIGHQSTADILTKLLSVEVPMNRIVYNQQVGDTAIIFKLKSRADEGKILSIEEIDRMGYEFGILTRIA